MCFFCSGRVAQVLHCAWTFNAGDAILNVRKAKLIPSYELCIKVKWEGSTADGQPGSGLIELPYVADENHDEDPEIRQATCMVFFFGTRLTWYRSTVG
jgi:activator of HSP90 ATPase